MKTLQKLVLAFGLVGLLYSCQSTNQVLSKSEKRTEIMKTIANDEIMSKEMMGELMNSKSGKMMMMKGMMAKVKNDDAMMSDMCKSMMDNPEMMKMMEKMKAEKMDTSKMKGMDKKSN